MTEGQRDYLADLAAQKGVKLEDTSNVSVAWASAKIEELKSMPDAEFDVLDKETVGVINSDIDAARKELSRWTFQQ